MSKHSHALDSAFVTYQIQGKNEQLHLNELKNAHVFDRFKHGNQETFYSLIHLTTDDEILLCRKAELQILMQNFTDALETLKNCDSLLAKGLKAKIHYCLNQDNEFTQETAHLVFSSNSNITLLSQEQKEGMVHIYEMTALFTARRELLNLTEQFLLMATNLATELNMQGRLKNLSNHAKALNLDIQISGTSINAEDKNLVTNRYEAITEFIDTWKEGNPVINETYLSDYKPIIKAWEAIKKNQFQMAFNNLKGSSYNDLKIYEALVMITIIAETKNHHQNFKTSLDVIRSELTTLSTPSIIINVSAKVFPLAFLIASEHIDAFKEAKATIPILASETYRDGLRLEGKTIVLPQKYRAAWLEDDAHPYDFPNLSLIHKTTRYRANLQFKKHDLKTFNIVSVTKYVKALINLVHLGFTEYEPSVKKLSSQYPTVKKYLA